VQEVGDVCGLAVLSTVFPDDNFIELDVRDCFRGGVCQIVEMFEQQHLECFFGAATCFDDFVQTFSLLGEDFVLASRFGFQLGVDCFCFCVGVENFLLCSGLGIDNRSGFSAFAQHEARTGSFQSGPYATNVKSLRGLRKLFLWKNITSMKNTG